MMRPIGNTRPARADLLMRCELAPSNDILYLVTALVPSLTACLASSLRDASIDVSSTRRESARASSVVPRERQANRRLDAARRHGVLVVHLSDGQNLWRQREGSGQEREQEEYVQRERGHAYLGADTTKVMVRKVVQHLHGLDREGEPASRP